MSTEKETERLNDPCNYFYNDDDDEIYYVVSGYKYEFGRYYTPVNLCVRKAKRVYGHVELFPINDFISKQFLEVKKYRIEPDKTAPEIQWTTLISYRYVLSTLDGFDEKSVIKYLELCPTYLSPFLMWKVVYTRIDNDEQVITRNKTKKNAQYVFNKAINDKKCSDVAMEQEKYFTLF